MSHPTTSASVVGMNAAMAELVKLTMSWSTALYETNN